MSYCKTLKFGQHLVFAQVREGVTQGDGVRDSSGPPLCREMLGTSAQIRENHEFMKI